MDSPIGHNFHCAKCKVPFMNMNEVALHIKKFHSGELRAALESFNRTPDHPTALQENMKSGELLQSKSISSYESTSSEMTDVDGMFTPVTDIDTGDQGQPKENIQDYSMDEVLHRSDLENAHWRENKMEMASNETADNILQQEVCVSMDDRVIDQTRVNDDLVIIKILENKNIITEDLLKLYEDDDAVGKGLQRDKQKCDIPSLGTEVKSGSSPGSSEVKISERTETEEQPSSTSHSRVYAEESINAKFDDVTYQKRASPDTQIRPLPHFTETEQTGTLPRKQPPSKNYSNIPITSHTYVPAPKKRKLEFWEIDSEEEYMNEDATEDEEACERGELEDAKIRELLTDKFGPRERLRVDSGFEDLWRKCFKRKSWDSNNLGDLIDSHCWNRNH